MAVRADVLPDGSASPRAHDRPARFVRIAPAARWPAVDLRELWAYRGLFFFLVWRDIKVRYAQTVLGAGWAILQPVLATALFSLIFGRFARIPSDGLPYPLFALAGLVPWSYFATALTGATNSLVGNAHVMAKVYFPRFVIPVTPVLAGLLDLALAVLVLLLVMAGYGVVPPLGALVVVPLALAILMATATGVGCVLASLNIQYRDVKHVTPFLVQLWIFASPIVYPLSLVPERYQIAYALNPVAGAIAGFRAGLLGGAPVPWQALAVSLVSGLTLCVAGVLYFRRAEPRFADVA